MASSVLRAARPTATPEAPLEGQLPGSDKPFYVAFGRKKAPPGNVPEGRLTGSYNPGLC